MTALLTHIFKLLVVKHSDETHNLSIFTTLFLIGLFTKHHYRTPTTSLIKAR